MSQTKQAIATIRHHWQQVSSTEPARIDAYLDTLRLKFAVAGGKEQFRLAEIITDGMRAANDLRAMRSARLRQNMNLPTTRKGE